MDAHDDTRRPSTGRYLPAERSLSDWSSTLSRVARESIDPSVSILDRVPSSKGTIVTIVIILLNESKILSVPPLDSSRRLLQKIVSYPRYKNGDLDSR